MAKIHSSLKPSTNIVMIFLWAAIAGITVYISAPLSILVAGAGLILGALGGVMQRLAFAESKNQFLNASTMLEVRKKIKQTKWGKRYIPFLWLSNLMLVVVVIIMGKGNPFILVMSGFFSFMFIREIITLRSTFELAQLSKRNSEPNS